jgi:hypothetical protein
MVSTTTIRLKGRLIKNKNMSEIRRFRCDICGNEFENHIDVVGEVAFNCPDYHFFSDSVCWDCIGAIKYLVEERGGKVIPNQ